MSRVLRDGSGALLVLSALAILFYAVVQLRERDYLAAIFLIATGLSLARAGTELLRGVIGE